MRLVPTLLAAFPLACLVTLSPASAKAVGRDSASPVAKGTVGGALLGGEVVLLVEAAADVQSPWAYLGGGVLGAAAGGVGGYFVEQNASARVSMLLLAGGLTLAIPTTVAVLSATAYQPPADYLVDTPPADEPVADPPQPTPAAPATPAPASSPAPTSAPPTSAVPPRKHLAHRERLQPLRLTPPALLDFSPGRLALSIPAVEVQGTYTVREIAMYGLEQTTEVRVPFLSVVF